VLLTLWAPAVSGTLTVTARPLVNGQVGAPVVTFPVLSGPTTEVLLLRAQVTSEQVQVTLTYSGACTFEVQARAIYGGISDARILGANALAVTQVNVTTSPTLLVAAALTDRSGLVIKNWSGTSTMYIGQSAVQATTAVGYPLAPKDAIAMDVAAGVSVYAVADVGTADCRLAEAGG
jgi:hypothetical protein